MARTTSTRSFALDDGAGRLDDERREQERHRVERRASHARSMRLSRPVAGLYELALRDAGLERGGERLANGLELDAVQDVLEEAAHDQPLRVSAGEAARHRVEELFAVDAADRRAVGAADVVREDLEPGNRNGVRRRRQHEVAVLLVRVRLLRVLLDADHPPPHRGGRVAQRALEGEVGRRVRRDVLLERVVVEMLVTVGEVRTGDTGGSAFAGEVVLDPNLALLRAEAAGDPVELGVAADLRVVRGEVPGLL